MPIDVRRADLDNTRWVSYGDGATYPWSGPEVGVKTGYGFNTWENYNAYTNGSAENTTTMLTRLVNDYGGFKYNKQFREGQSFLPSDFEDLPAGAAHPLNPATVHIVCQVWTPGTIANGSRDSVLESFAASIPDGHRVILCINECDAPGRISDWSAYVADMDYLYDLAEDVNPGNAGRLESMDCFMAYALESGSGPRWQDSWTNAAKRHGIIWDHYWNNHNQDASGDAAVGRMETVMNRLGFTNWILGEWGDRRPGSDGASVPDDAARAARTQVHLDRLLAADPKPEGLIFFNTIGTTGDHRILRPPLGNDDLTYAVLRDAMAEAWEA